MQILVEFPPLRTASSTGDLQTEFRYLTPGAWAHQTGTRCSSIQSSRDLGHWFRFNPLGEIFNCHHQVLHLPDHQWERSQNVDSPRMKRPRAVNRLQFLGRRFVPIGVLLALLATLCVLLAVLPHCWPVVTCKEGSYGQSSTPDVASANPFMELGHDSCTFLSVHTFQEWVCEPKPCLLYTSDAADE